MPNRAHTPEFWRQVATAYKGNDRVIFDLFNEPFPDSNSDTPEAWRCWRDGGSCSGMSFQAAGMQELVDAVRGTRRHNVIILGGVQYAAGLSHWLANKPSDPLNNVAASWHIYNFSWCNTAACWDTDAAPVAQQVPLVLGELGQNDRGSGFVTALMDWMDARQGSYLAWVWDVWGSWSDLIASYDGTPTAYGQTFRTPLRVVDVIPPTRRSRHAHPVRIRDDRHLAHPIRGEGDRETREIEYRQGETGAAGIHRLGRRRAG